MRRLDENGHEVPDPRPMTIPSGFKRPETLAEQVQRLVRTSISAYAAAQGKETFEEAEDFDIGDEADPSTPYETFFDPVLGKELTPSEFRQYENIYRERYLKAQQDYFQAMDRQEALRRPRKSGGEGGSPPSDASAVEPRKRPRRAKSDTAESADARPDEQ